MEMRSIFRLRRGGQGSTLRRLRTMPLLLCAALLGGCALSNAPPCPSSQRQVSELLYFGTAQPQGVVAAQDWADFLDKVITPRFPQGLSVWPAAGQWQSTDGTLVRENTWVLHVVHPENDSAEQAIASIMTAYKTRFQQEAVLRVQSRVCVSL